MEPVLVQQDCVLFRDRRSSEVVSVMVLDSLNNPAAGRTVWFTSSGGKIADSARTNAEGVAQARWTGDATNTRTMIEVTTVVQGRPRRRTVLLGWDLPPELAISALSPRSPFWYQGRQVRRPVVFEVTNATLRPAQATCESATVAFRAFGDGAVSPDTTRARWDTGRGRCVAEARWRLGPVVGEQQLRATLVGTSASPAEVVARARALPYLAMGLAISRVEGYNRLAERREALRVTRRFQAANGDTVEIAYDSTRLLRSADRFQSQWLFSPVIGISFPFLLAAGTLRTTLAADLRNPTTEWFLGFSLPQWSGGLQHEGVGFDVQVIGHLSRRSVLLNPTECVANQAVCSVAPQTRLVGAGLMLSIDTSPLLERLVGAFGGAVAK